jgi:two-component system, chemotaxis family, sensor kinase CheA
MFIDDEELRSLYEVASAEHLTAIEAGLLQLEKDPIDLAPLPMLLREAHSLKGDSRMLGVEDAETVVHQMEEILMAIDRQATPVTPQLCDGLYQGLDAIKKIANEAITGEPTGLRLFEVIATLMELGGIPGSSVATAAPIDDIPPFALPALAEQWAPVSFDELSFPTSSELDDFANFTSFADAALGENSTELYPIDFATPISEAALFDPAIWAIGAPEVIEASQVIGASQVIEAPITTPITNASTPAEPLTGHETEVFEINTIRVAAGRLERLMIQADELAVAKLRVVQRHDDLLNLYRLWEDWSRIAPSHDPRIVQFSNLLHQLQLTSSEDTARLESVTNDLENGIRQIRMLPLRTVFALFPRMVRDLARQQGKEIDLTIEGGEVLADKQILESLKDPLTHILRNAIDHGIELPADRPAKSTTAQLSIRGVQRGNQIEIIITDDGRGLDLEAIRATAIRRGLYNSAELDQMNPEQIQSLIFVAGFSTRTNVTEISGRGIGMDIVRTNIEKLKGSIRLESTPGQGCVFRILLNNSLATVDALIVQVNNQPFALALDAIETMQFIDRQEIFTLDGKLTVHWQERGVSVAWLADY